MRGHLAETATPAPGDFHHDPGRRGELSGKLSGLVSNFPALSHHFLWNIPGDLQATSLLSHSVVYSFNKHNEK